MKKYSTLLILLLAMATGQVKALTLERISSARGYGILIEVFFVANSNFSKFIADQFERNCETGTLDIYVNDENFYVGHDQVIKAYSCQLGSDNRFGTEFKGRFVVFHQSEYGGSKNGDGVFAVAHSKALPFLNVNTSSCSQATKKCRNMGFTKIPDGGASDLSPYDFNSALNRSPGYHNYTDQSIYPDVSKYDFGMVGSVFQKIYGVAVSQPLYAALKADQGVGVGRPSVPKAVVASMLSNVFDPAMAWKALLPNSSNEVRNRQINICRMYNSAGAQVAANRFFLEYSVNAASLLPASNASDSEFTNDFQNIGNNGVIMVHEGWGDQGVRDCLSRAGNIGAFAIGHLPIGSESTRWHFVKLDGIEASVENAKRGIYPYVFESTMQIRRNAGAVQSSFLNRFITSISDPYSLYQALAGSGPRSVMALPGARVCAETEFGSHFPSSPGDHMCSRVHRPKGSNILTVLY